ncbi:cellulose-binding domain-containing protein [Streptosporangium sp. NPDC004379]|uniref:cellulose-binding domain-containing protein n=1 Tax=Streptosporangium sp. NPDC004379 TaxID=3366189 RepID=UPI0036BE4D14
MALPASFAARFRAVAVSAALVLGGLAATAAVPAAALPDTGCRVDYTLNQWQGGFTAQVKVTNLGPAVNGWRLRWTFGGDQRVTSAWSAQVGQSGTTVTATNVSWNASLPTGGTADFGLQGTWTAADPVPADFTLNDVACNGAGSPSPSVTPTATPTATPTVTPTATPTATPTVTPTVTPTATPTVTPTGEPGCAGAAVCSGFEDQTGVPAGDWQVVTPNCSGSGTAVVDTSVAHSGSRSLRINGGGGYCNHVFAGTTRDVSAVGPVVYGRMWVRHTTALPTGHISMITMADSRDGGRDLRVGGQNGALQWNRESDDATLPEQSPTGVSLSTPLPVGRWVCLRYEIDTTRQSIRTLLDDREVAGLRVDGVPTQDVDSQWLRRTTAPRPTTLRLGWESYSGDQDTIWYDDVALSSSPLSC